MLWLGLEVGKNWERKHDKDSTGWALKGRPSILKSSSGVFSVKVTKGSRT